METEQDKASSKEEIFQPTGVQPNSYQLSHPDDKSPGFGAKILLVLVILGFLLFPPMYATNLLGTESIFNFFHKDTFYYLAVADNSTDDFYSYDGEKFIFDAEPLGGATTRGLQRSELSKLESIKEVDGKYKIMVRNEVEETQYLDELSLYVVDHSPEYEIYPDISCNIHSVKNLEPPLFAEDEN